MDWREKYLNKVTCGDCLELMKELPDKCIDLVVTDPPYGIDVCGKSGKPREREREDNITTVGIKGACAPKSYWGFDDTRIPSKEVFDEMKRVSKNQVIFGGNYFTSYLEPSSCWLVWDKDNGESFFADCELVWTSFKTAVRKFKWKWNGMLQEDMAHKEEREHPTQKPVPLMGWILNNYSKDTDLILDPFLGSGTTAVAAKMLKRNFIGFEISEKYCEIARERLRQEILI